MKYKGIKKNYISRFFLKVKQFMAAFLVLYDYDHLKYALRFYHDCMTILTNGKTY